MSDTLIVEARTPPRYSSSYDFSVFDRDFGGSSPDVLDALRLGERIEACEDGTKTAQILETCKAAVSHNQMDMVLRLLRAAAYADDRRAKFPTEALFSNYEGDASNGFQPTYQTELTNSAFAPLAALFHYTFGNGEPMFVNLDKLSFNLNQNNMAPISRLLESGQVGVFQINEWMGYDFKESSYWEWSYLGRISLLAQGTLKIDDQGNWTFQGAVSGTKDIYDPNPDPSRGAVGESLTDVLRSLKGTDFDINFQGEHKVIMAGKK